MKKGIIIVLAALLTGSAAFAQEEKPSHFKLYGFIRHYLTADTRAVNAGTEDLYFYMPKDLSMSDLGDMNAGLNWRFVSLTTRLGLDVSGYKIGTMGVSGKVEADFYNLSSAVPILRLRQAFIKLNWDNVPLALTIGQTWHPMAADMPHMNNLETGAPFNPFNRSPQLTLDWSVGGGFGIMASLLYLNHYLPTGPAGKSKDYYKYGIPEAYLGVYFKNKHFLAKAGVDMVNLKPVEYVGYNKKDDVLDETALVRGYTIDKKIAKASGFLTTVSPFVFLQYTNGLFQLRAKAILAQSGEHMNLLSGYGYASLDDVNYRYTYTPMQDLASFVSFCYGKKFQVLGMLGYMKQLGTTQDLAGALWLNSAADTRVQQAFRATPTVAWNIGKFTVSLEYNYTMAEFGNSKAAGFDADAKRNVRGLYQAGDTHWVHNHRFICMTKFTF